MTSRDKFSAADNVRDGLSVEHIMPQEWRKEWLLPSKRTVPERGGVVADESKAAEMLSGGRLIHTLANLSLLTPPGNSSARNSSFETKKTCLRDCEIADNAHWGETEIYKRAKTLAELAVKEWPAPPMMTAH